MALPDEIGHVGLITRTLAAPFFRASSATFSLPGRLPLHVGASAVNLSTPPLMLEPPVTTTVLSD
jgi:hypothetical protein